MDDSASRLYPLDATDLAPGTSRAFCVNGISILICNVDGEFFALENRCSHAKAPLADGRLQGHRLECPLHGAVFDVRTGKPERPPARRAVPIFPVEAKRGWVHITLPNPAPR